jgi:predicted MPP superfamily phosphohydrolase
VRLRTLIPATAALGAATLGYVTVVERNWFALRRYEVPVLPPGAPPLRVLHISDSHLTPGRKRLMSWIRSLEDLDPDLVINTGDSISHPQAVQPLLDALGPLLDRPGAFVLGSNDMYAPEAHNPARYLTGASSRWRTRKEPDLPWEKLRDDLTAAGWLDLNNHRGRLTAGGRDIALAGVHDSHVKLDRYEQIAGRADRAADLRIGVMHSPEPRLLDRFEADGYELLLAGHTHGGQLRLPFYGALVTNCGIEKERVSGLHRHPVGGQAWLHISAGLGTSPWAPARFACRPEASLLTLVSRDPG